MRKLILAILCAVMFSGCLFVSGCVGVKRYNKDIDESYALGFSTGKLEESIKCIGEIIEIKKRHEIDIREFMFPSMDGFSIDISTAQLKLLNKNRPIR